MSETTIDEKSRQEMIEAEIASCRGCRPRRPDCHECIDAVDLLISTLRDDDDK